MITNLSYGTKANEPLHSKHILIMWLLSKLLLGHPIRSCSNIVKSTWNISWTQFSNKKSTVCLHRVAELLTDVSSFGILLLNNRYNQSILVPRYDFWVSSFEIWFHFRFVTWLGQNIRMNLFRPTVILKIKFSFGGIHLLLRLVYFWKNIYV